MDKEWSEKNIGNRRRLEDFGREQIVEKKRNERFIRIFKRNKLH